MQSGATISTDRWTHSDDEHKILTPGDEYNESHKGWRIVRQARALKEHFGFGTVFGLIAVFISLATPIAYQSKTNGANAAAIENLAKAQQDSKADTQKAINDAVQRIETQINKSVELSEKNATELRSIRESQERQFIEVRQDTKALWNWMGELKNKITTVEADIKTRK